MNLRVVPYKEIKKNKWDYCINQSPNGLIYSKTECLDAMAANWDGIILDDYIAVMPLIWKKKYGIYYLYQPEFLQQTGITSLIPLDENSIIKFIQLAQSTYKFAEISLNYSNVFTGGVKKNNFILPLVDEYRVVKKNYSTYITERLKRAEKFNLSYESTNDFDYTINLFVSLYSKKMTFKKNDIINLKTLCSSLLRSNQLIVRNIKHNNETIASVIMLKDHRRLYNIMSAITEKGRKLLANYVMFDNIICEYANMGLTLDFEGSDKDSIAYFYKKFTDINEQYTFIRWNKLPLPIRWLK